MLDFRSRAAWKIVQCLVEQGNASKIYICVKKGEHIFFSAKALYHRRTVQTGIQGQYRMCCRTVSPKRQECITIVGLHAISDLARKFPHRCAFLCIAGRMKVLESEIQQLRGSGVYIVLRHCCVGVFVVTDDFPAIAQSYNSRLLFTSNPVAVPSFGWISIYNSLTSLRVVIDFLQRTLSVNCERNWRTTY